MPGHSFAMDRVDVDGAAHNSLKLVQFAGGSRNSTASILTRLHALAEAEQQLADHSIALQKAQAALQSMAAAAASHNRYCTTRASWLSSAQLLKSMYCPTQVDHVMPTSMQLLSRTEDTCLVVLHNELPYHGHTNAEQSTPQVYPMICGHNAAVANSAKQLAPTKMQQAMQ